MIGILLLLLLRNLNPEFIPLKGKKSQEISSDWKGVPMKVISITGKRNFNIRGECIVFALFMSIGQLKSAECRITCNKLRKKSNLSYIGL